MRIFKQDDIESFQSLLERHGVNMVIRAFTEEDSSMLVYLCKHDAIKCFEIVSYPIRLDSPFAINIAIQKNAPRCFSFLMSLVGIYEADTPKVDKETFMSTIDNKSAFFLSQMINYYDYGYEYNTEMLLHACVRDVEDVEGAKEASIDIIKLLLSICQPNHAIFEEVIKKDKYDVLLLLISHMLLISHTKRPDEIRVPDLCDLARGLQKEDCLRVLEEWIKKIELGIK